MGLTVSMTDCILSGNHANSAGGAVWLQGTYTTVNGCTVSGNSTVAQLGYQGGAIDNYITPYMLTVTDSVFSNNTPYAYGPHGNKLVYDAVHTAINGLWTNGGGNTFS
jgi:parallel beta-helix repeat protein